MSTSIVKPALLILGSGLITYALRAVPFLIFSDQRPLPPLLTRLASALPPCLMAILVVYSLKDLPGATLNIWLARLGGIGVVVTVHLWKHQTILSIITGTVCYMLLSAWL